MQEGRDVWWHRELEYVGCDCPAAKTGQRSSALHPLHQRVDRQTQGHLAHDRRLSCSGQADDPKYVFDLREDDVYWCTADIGWVTGHSYVVYGPLANGATSRDVRRRAELAGAGPVLADHREIRRHDPLHGADGDPRVHEVGRRMAEEARSDLAASAGHGRRADQSRGLDVVSHKSSAASDVRSSTPGGRPRPARS